MDVGAFVIGLSKIFSFFSSFNCIQIFSELCNGNAKHSRTVFEHEGTRSQVLRSTSVDS